MNEEPTVEPDLLFNQISVIIKNAHQQVRKVLNNEMVCAYWQIGRLIVETEQNGKQRANYGEQQLQKLAARLTLEFGKNFDVSNLRRMRKFYTCFPIQDTLCPELSWSHYRVLLRVEKPAARLWYMQESALQNWSVRGLDRQIGTLYYERLLISQQKAPVEEEAAKHTQDLQVSAMDYLRDPYVLDFLNLPKQHVLESELEQGLMDNLQKFLLELGKGFAFVARQQRIMTDDGDFYIDLVFYNFHLKCFVLIDLKIGKLTYQDVGQMDMYVRMFEEKKRRQDDNPTIGLILCSERNETVAKYSVLNDSKQLFASKYLLELPSEEELRLELERERRIVLQQLEGSNEQ